ncbi:MAG: hypothetical protein J0H88_05310 [Sphingomonadales bacterium]|nr:hypothetical protein [Sphingomonadales bacterium]
MTKYFTIITSGTTPDHEAKMVEKWKDLGWWHAFPNFWLLRDHFDQLDAPAIRDQITAIAPAARIFVQEADPKMWAARSLNESNREWLRNYWPPEGG